MLLPNLITIKTYFFGPACEEDCGHVKGKLDNAVVMAQTAAHLVPRAQVHQGPELCWPPIPPYSWGVLAILHFKIID